MRANERMDERVALYLRLYSCLFQTTVHWKTRKKPRDRGWVKVFSFFLLVGGGDLLGNLPLIMPREQRVQRNAGDLCPFVGSQLPAVFPPSRPLWPLWPPLWPLWPLLGPLLTPILLFSSNCPFFNVRADSMYWPLYLVCFSLPLFLSFFLSFFYLSFFLFFFLSFFISLSLSLLLSFSHTHSHTRIHKRTHTYLHPLLFFRLGWATISISVHQGSYTSFGRPPAGWKHF